MDYEHQPANHLAFRFASRLIVPDALPEEALSRYGAQPARVFRYHGIKEDVYLAGFQADPKFPQLLNDFGITPAGVLVTVRPPASDALYHRFENQLFDQLLDRLSAKPHVKIVLLPRNESQRHTYSARNQLNLIIPDQVLDGANLIAHSDLVISAGGTMNREAAALGVPVASIYLGEWAAIDSQLLKEGRLQKLGTIEDVDKLRLEKKRANRAQRNLSVRSEVARLILDS
jgi:predicted glycosyltransferase